MEWRIAIIGNNPTVEFAAQELKKYIPRIDGTATAALLKTDAYTPEWENVLWVGRDKTMPAPKLECNVTKSKFKTDPELDDAIAISVHGRAGYITGSNDRSVLLAAYRFLTKAGMRWIRPGTVGERVIPRSLEDFSMKLVDRPLNRHRGVCIEGAVSYDHVADIIDWLPKVGMNSYFFQFQSPIIFMGHWYQRANANRPVNPYAQWRMQPISPSEAEAMSTVLKDEVKRRGMLLHSVGHGWNSAPFGLEYNDWFEEQKDIPPETVQYLAMLDGKRFVRKDKPIYTNMCYSNPVVRTRIVEYIVDYAKRHPNVDYLHIWLADNGNNHCECDECQKARPADFYVMMLNELDALMTREGIPMRLVFLLYVDLFWPPVQERLANTERFTLMFAPIFRDYSSTYIEAGDKREILPFERNNLQFPKSLDDNLAHLKAWQDIFTGDGFDYDYHLYSCYFDPGGLFSAKILFDDMMHLPNIGLNGMSSCQCQRVFFPIGLHMKALAVGLWGGVTFDEMVKAHMYDVFGDDGPVMQDYFETVAQLFDPAYLHNKKPQVSEESARQFATIPDYLNSQRPLFEARLSQAQCEADRYTWQYMLYFIEIYTRYSQALHKRALGNDEEALALWKATEEYLWSIEKDIHHAMDNNNLCGALGRLFVAEAE